MFGGNANAEGWRRGRVLNCGFWLRSWWIGQSTCRPSLENNCTWALMRWDDPSTERKCQLLKPLAFPIKIPTLSSTKCQSWFKVPFWFDIDSIAPIFIHDTQNDSQTVYGYITKSLCKIVNRTIPLMCTKFFFPLFFSNSLFLCTKIYRET